MKSYDGYNNNNSSSSSSSSGDLEAVNKHRSCLSQTPIPISSYAATAPAVAATQSKGTSLARKFVLFFSFPGLLT